jgi:hypothetical protein
MKKLRNGRAVWEKTEGELYDLKIKSSNPSHKFIKFTLQTPSPWSQDIV